jgi:hypothetical protein
MLSDAFIARLSDAFPLFYARIDDEARLEAQRLLQEAGGDVDRAVMRARLDGAGRLWWPYVQGSMPIVGDDRAAMEAFARLVLTVDHVIGYRPQGVEGARQHVLDVLRHTLDVERLVKLVRSDGEGKAAAAGAGLVASVAAFVAPLSVAKRALRWGRWLPVPARIAVGGAAIAALASIPVVAAYSAGRHAESAARNFGETPATPAASSIVHARTVSS